MTKRTFGITMIEEDDAMRVYEQLEEPRLALVGEQQYEGEPVTTLVVKPLIDCMTTSELREVIVVVNAIHADRASEVAS